jgi:hypothetical protein
VIERAVLGPNPIRRGAGKLWLKVQGRAEYVEIRAFTPRLVLAWVGGQAVTPGKTMLLNVDARPWPLGAVFLQVIARGPEGADKKIIKAFVLP